MLARIIFVPSSKESVKSADAVRENTLKMTGVDASLHSGFTPRKIKNLDYTILSDYYFGGMFDVKLSKEAEIATWFSHASVWEIAVALNEPMLVLEDDAQWKTEIDLTQIAKDFDGDILNFGIPLWGEPSGIERDLKKESGVTKREWCNKDHYDHKGIYRYELCDCNSLWLFCAHAYIVTPKGARKLLAAKENGILPADIYIRREIVDIYDYYPWPCQQDKTYKMSLIKV